MGTRSCGCTSGRRPDPTRDPDGEAKPGERLPPAKDLAAVLGVNTNTVLRPTGLRDEGLLEFRRGRGILSQEHPNAAPSSNEQGARPLRPAHGYRLDELIEIIEDVG